jgi:hypothetical protein
MKSRAFHSSDIRIAALISLLVSYVLSTTLLLINVSLTGWETVGALLLMFAWPVMLAWLILIWNIR